MDETTINKWALKDIRLHKSGITKSFVENHGSLPDLEFLDNALELIYTLTEREKKILEKSGALPEWEKDLPF